MDLRCALLCRRLVKACRSLKKLRITADNATANATVDALREARLPQRRLSHLRLYFPVGAGAL